MKRNKDKKTSLFLPLVDGLIIGLVIFFLSLIIALTVESKTNDALELSANNELRNIAKLGAALLKDPKILAYLQAPNRDTRSNSEAYAVEALHTILQSSSAVNAAELFALIDKKTFRLARVTGDTPLEEKQLSSRAVSDSGLNSALRYGRADTHLEKVKGKVPVLWAYAPIVDQNNTVVAALGVKHEMNFMQQYLYLERLGIMYSPSFFATLLGVSCGVLVWLIQMSRTQYSRIFSSNKELVSYLASHDTITKSLNRKGLETRLIRTISRASRRKEQLLIMHVDLIYPRDQEDALAEVNTEIIKEISERLKAQLREYDILARLNHQQFVIAVEGLHKKKAMNLMVTRILDALQDPYHIDNNKFSPEARAGIALYPGSGKDANSLLKNAELALRHAKTRNIREHFFEHNLLSKAGKQKPVKNG